HQRDQAGVRNHQMKRQAQYRERIVCIKPGALTRAPTESEKINEDLFVGDDTADNGDQHEHRALPCRPPSPKHGHIMELEVEAVEEFPSDRLALAYGLCLGRVDGGAFKTPALATPECTDRIVACIGQ